MRDGAPWVAEAIESILGQTLAELELVVVDDGSPPTTDAWPDAARFADARWRVGRRTRASRARSNEGVSAGARAADGAPRRRRRAAPERLARQLAFLDAHPEIGLLGTGAIEIDARGVRSDAGPAPRGCRHPARTLIRRNIFVHSSS